jgi:molybdenum cofactor cytidylyltransferase
MLARESPRDGAVVAGVVLAAGSSSRLGQNKLLLDLGGETLVHRSVRAAVQARLSPIVVVLGHEAPRVRSELADLACRPVLNPNYAQGVGTSLQTGVAEVAADSQALVVVLADMPFVSTAMIEAVVQRYRTSGARLVVSSYGEVDAPPILYDRSLFAELLGIPGERCAKQVVRRHRSEAEAVAWPEDALRDIDVAEDYEHARVRIVDAQHRDQSWDR